jgi:putative transcriptional regulator
MEDKENIWSYEFERNKGLKAGQLLLSEPFMFDENFRRTVVLVCEHTTENGTVGLILNKPINLRLNDVVEGFPAFKGKIFLGGPVGTDTMQFLHCLGHKIENSLKLADNLYWGGNFEQVKEMLGKGEIQIDQVRFFLGYSGWSAGQLEDELKENAWIITQATNQHIFSTPYDNLWKNTMKEMGGVYNTMAGYPENPGLN